MSNGNYSEVVRLVKLGRRAEQRGKAIQGCITALLTSIIAAFFSGWMFMLGVAVLSAHWWSALPTIGYWWSVVAVALLRGVFSRSPAPASKS
jgi:hypothetical protein